MEARREDDEDSSQEDLEDLVDEDWFGDEDRLAELQDVNTL
jgi:hypothetical protein